MLLGHFEGWLCSHHIFAFLPAASRVVWNVERLKYPGLVETGQVESLSWGWTALAHQTVDWHPECTSGLIGGWKYFGPQLLLVCYRLKVIFWNTGKMKRWYQVLKVLLGPVFISGFTKPVTFGPRRWCLSLRAHQFRPKCKGRVEYLSSLNFVSSMGQENNFNLTFS